MEFLVEFELEVPRGTSESEVEQVTITPLASHPNDPNPAAP